MKIKGWKFKYTGWGLNFYLGENTSPFFALIWIPYIGRDETFPTLHSGINFVWKGGSF